MNSQPVVKQANLDDVMFLSFMDCSSGSWAVAVAQLVEWLLPTPEVCNSNPVNGFFYKKKPLVYILSTVLKRQK